MARARKTVVPAPQHWRDTPYSPGPIPGDPQVDRWPIPNNCAYIWIAGDPKRGVVQPRLGFPPSDGHARGHSVGLPYPQGVEAKAQAWDLLMKVLRDRQPNATIATSGAPDQRVLDAYAAALARGQKVERIAQGVSGKKLAEAEALLEHLGIDVDDLDLEF